MPTQPEYYLEEANPGVSKDLQTQRVPESVISQLRLIVEGWGDRAMRMFIAVGDFSIFTWRVFVWMFTAKPSSGTVLPNFYSVGVLSLPVVMLTGLFIGMVLAHNTYFQFKGIGLESRVGGVINMSLVRELGPVLAATMLAGRVGSAMAAVLGTMRVTEQIDALKSMGANPIHYLVVPRFLACVLLIPALCVMADFTGIIGGYFYSVVIRDVEHYQYLRFTQDFVGAYDFFAGIIKSFFFGGVIAVVSCYQGFHCEPGAEGVGKAATMSFVISFVIILILDLILNILLDAVYFRLWPRGGAKLI